MPVYHVSIVARDKVALKYALNSRWGNLTGSIATLNIILAPNKKDPMYYFQSEKAPYSGI